MSTITGFLFLAAGLGFAAVVLATVVLPFAATLFTGLAFDFFLGDELLVSSGFLFCESKSKISKDNMTLYLQKNCLENYLEIYDLK